MRTNARLARTIDQIGISRSSWLKLMGFWSGMGCCSRGKSFRDSFVPDWKTEERRKKLRQPAKPGRNFEELYGGSYSSLALDQPAITKAASKAGMRMQAQRLVWVAMSLMCSPPIRSSATRHARGPKAKRANKSD